MMATSGVFEPLVISGTVALSLLLCRLLEALWSRRWQLQDAILGGSPYELLSSAYEAETIGVIRIEAEEPPDDADHDHDHDHDHGPRDVAVVSQRWALVTGGSRGIGRAFVRVLSDQGFSLIVIDKDDADLASTCAQATKRLERGWRGGVWRRTSEQPTVVAIGCDVAADVAVAVCRCEEAVAALPSGALRLLVNNVGTATPVPSLLAQHSAADVEHLVSTNAGFTIKLTHALWPSLAAGATGNTGAADAAGATGAVVDGSVAGRRAGVLFVSTGGVAQQPAPFASVYAATKGAVEAFARSLRAEASGLGLGLDVLCVTPGLVRAGHAPRWEGSPAGLAEPDDVAHASLLLLETACTATLAPLLSDAIAASLAGSFSRCFLTESARGARLFRRRAAQRMPACVYDASERCCVCLRAFADRLGRHALVPCAHVVCSRCATEEIRGMCPTCKHPVAEHVKVD